MPNRVIHFDIQADDIERAKKFYEKSFGWKIEKWTGEEGMMDYWLIMTGPKEVPGIDGGLYMRPKENPIHTFDSTIQVDDIDKAIADVKKNGGTIHQEKMLLKGVGWFAGAKDTEGNKFALMQPVGWKPE